MADLLRSERREGLDPRWHICPAGSVGRIPAMLGLLGNSVDTTVLIDSPANRTERGNDRGTALRPARLVEIADVIDGTDGDIEDLISADDYLTAFNTCFGTAFTDADLKSQAPRITQRLEHAHGKYNHGDVARVWVQERAAGRLSVSDGTKDSFEKLFKRINATLGAETHVRSRTLRLPSSISKWPTASSLRTSTMRSSAASVLAEFLNESDQRHHPSVDHAFSNSAAPERGRSTPAIRWAPGRLAIADDPIAVVMHLCKAWPKCRSGTHSLRTG